jgi:hypothetical protein
MSVVLPNLAVLMFTPDATNVPIGMKIELGVRLES